MKKFLAVLSLAAAALPAFGQALPAPEIAARNFLLLDMNAQQVLAERDADAAVDPAALTKLMTAWLAFVALRDHKLELAQTLPVSTRAWDERKAGGALMFVDPKTTPTVDQLLQGLIVDAGSDAAVVLAEGIGGSVEGFVAMMNRQAQAWGLKNTAFRNPTGATEAGQRSSARDLAAIARHLVREFPEHYHYFGQRSFDFNHVHQESRNLLLARDPSVDGLATGATEAAAGWSQVASAQREFPNGQRRLVAVVLGTDSIQARANEAQKLLNWGFTAFDDIRLIEAGKAVATVPVWKGASAQVGIGSTEPIYVAVPKGEGSRLRTRVERTDPLVAPLVQGQRVGSLKVATASGTAIAEISLTVLEPVPEAGLLGRAWDAVRLWIK
jgi:D-alanyl-D-alanine carboxypeptidase (penicillin-binding protein 5/6)